MDGRSKPIVPRNGHTLVVGLVARISGCTNQKEVSLDDQQDHGKQTVADYYQGPVEYRSIATKGKGERLDRPELAEVERLLRSGELDLLVVEDIGRLVRGTEAVRLCGIAVDHGTRVIAPNDCVDTAEDSWEEDVISACRDHVGHNAHTSKRLKFKMMNRFKKFGGSTAREIYGYFKPAEARTYDDWQKDDTATPIYEEWKRRLRETRNCSAVADWLNREQVPVGKYARRKSWDGKMVRRITANPLLMGKPQRGGKHTVKHHETGRRVSVTNPQGPQFWDAPHLAFWTPEEFEEINTLLESRNGPCRRKPINGTDSRWQVPRKRTRYPGQHARCWYCGRQCVWGGNGVTANLMCSGAREWRCWNSIGFNGALAAQRIVEAVTTELYKLEGFDSQFRKLVSQAQTGDTTGLKSRWNQLARRETTVGQEKTNILEAIVAYGPKPMFAEKLKEMEIEERALVRERRDLENLQNRTLQVPESVTQLRHILEDKFQHLAMASPEFGDLLRQLVPEFWVYLVRLCDGGHPLPRAKVRLDLGGILSDVRHVPGLDELLTREVTLDLFKQTPQRERIRVEAVRLAAQRLDQREIARRLPEKASQAAVSDALALDSLMQKQGLTTPYVFLTEPPPDYAKLRRHKNPKYRFEPVEGYVRTMI